MEVELFKECHGRLSESEYFVAVETRHYNIKSAEIFLIVAPIVGIISLSILLFTFGILTFSAMKRQILMKNYIFVLNRTLTDIIVSLIIVCISIVATVENAYFAISVLSLFVVTFGVVQCSVSHILHIIVVQLSHQRTAFYNDLLKSNKTTACSVIFWLGCFLYSAMFAPIFVAISDPLYANNVCSFGFCQKPLIFIAIVLNGFLISTCVVAYFFVLRKLFMGVKEQRMRNELPLNKYKMIKFTGYGGHVALYCLISILIIVGMVFVYKSMAEIDLLLNPKHQCKIIQHMNAVNQLQTICGGIILVWLVRIIFDPIILLANEYRTLIPWIGRTNGIHQLDEAHSTFSSYQSQSLKWERHCPIIEMERTISAWDTKT